MKYNAFNQDAVRKRHLQKIWLVMKVTTFLMLLALSTASASSFGQKVTLSEKNAALETLIDQLRQQTGYGFLYPNALLDGKKRVSVQLNGVALEDALRQILKDQPIAYEIENNNVILKEAAPSFLDRVVTAFQSIDVRGRVVDEQGKPMSGATIQIKGKNQVYKSNDKGEFNIPNVAEDAVLVISYVGYTSLEISLKDAVMPLEIKLNQQTGELEEVTVVYSDGFSKIPKERATGSFTHIDNETLNKQVSSDILSRLEGTVPGLRVPVNGGAGNNLILRGEASIRSDKNPLIVVDNFIYTGRIDFLNPNDIESVTVLKDAAAASIYGSQAGNGVIVITTKAGKKNKKPEIEFSTNMSITEKDRFDKLPYISVGEFVELERLNFTRGFSLGAENSNNKPALSPVEELLIAKRDGKISAQEAETQIDALGNRPNIYKDYQKYIYRNQTTQRHNLNVSGGGDKYSYYISGGYDRDLRNKIYNDNSRKTLSVKNTFNPIKSFQISTNLSYFNVVNNVSNINESNYPYEHLVNDNGLPASVIYSGTSRGGYRESFIDQAMAAGLLDWRYRPLEEIEMGKNSNSETSMLFNTGISFQPTKFLSLQLLYQIQTLNASGKSLVTADMYEFRDLYNKYTNIDLAGNMTNPIPYGGIVYTNTGSGKAQSARGQLNFNKIWNNRHSITALMAAELSENTSYTHSDKKYGFTEQGLTYAAVDFVNPYPNYITGNPSYINYLINENETINRKLSYFGNASYSFKNRYTATASLRKDGANLFGVNTNQKWNPFWSTGLSWEISREDFFNANWISYLKLRSTYGYTGTVASANSYLIVNYISLLTDFYRLQQSIVESPPNPDLRWERQKNLNFGLDFGIKNRFYGSFEYFIKNGQDLLYNSPLDPTSGFWIANNNYSVIRNYANMVSRGVDLHLNFKNINGRLQWNTSLVLGYSRSTVKKVFGTINTSSYLASGGTIIENEYFRTLYSYKWGGLSGIDGSPIGYIKGIATNNYSQLASQTKVQDLIKHGSTVPVYHGSLRNSLSYKNFSIDFSLTYRLGYYFRRDSYTYSSTMNNNIHKDYSLRWKQMGDEINTTVPSIPINFISARNAFYQNSEILVERGDHIRLQYVNLCYNLGQLKLFSKSFRSCQFFVNASNLGLLWTYNRKDIDPESQLMPISKTVSIGLRTTLK